MKTREIFGSEPAWANHLVQGKMLGEGIGFGLEDSFRSLIFHEFKRRLHKPHLRSKDQVPPRPNASTISLFNSWRFCHSVPLNSWVRICSESLYSFVKSTNRKTETIRSQGLLVNKKFILPRHSRQDELPFLLISKSTEFHQHLILNLGPPRCAPGSAATSPIENSQIEK